MPPEISLTISAPASSAAIATSERVVSTEIGREISGRKTCNTGKTRLSSSVTEICSAPGRVD